MKVLFCDNIPNNQNNMKIPPEKSVESVAEGTEPSEGETSLPVYYKLEEITSLGPDLGDREIGSRGMPFAATYLGFWELHRAFFEAIRANQLQGDNTKQMMGAAKERARDRFIAIYDPMPRIEPEELETVRNFWGHMFITGVTNGITLFTEWTKTPEGTIGMAIGAMATTLKVATGIPEEHLGLSPEA